MATGTVYYWNGDSGWIKQTGVENVPTALARDVMVLEGNITSGVINPTTTPNATVSFDLDSGDNFWRALNVVVS